ncbi:MADS-box transcription factor 26-like [Iris pallida]|uniref:MADS-box transcription factor 26-like n=1 Tax=Iris pallida TaxID=29817 RepID=A0AAX6ENK9_IRIPA|nr:MADS-box transcription factor 26-like [Iris pallida]
MARGKVQMRRMENPVHRQITFCKRRAGLLKKAKELSVLCDAEVGVIIYSTHGKLYELATNNGNMQGLIERYMTFGEAQTEVGDANLAQEPKQEIFMLKQEIDLLQRSLRYMCGEGGSSDMTLNELLALENFLEMWMDSIRTTKMKVMIQEIQLLKDKEIILKAANELLQEKIVEQKELLLDTATLIGFFKGTPRPYMLTTMNENVPI